MSRLMHWVRVSPVAATSTFLLYAAIVCFLVSPRFRRWVGTIFVTPLPSTHAYSGALDAYRGLAAMLVAFSHLVFFCYPVFWASKDVSPYVISYGGNKAVPVFVMLSGFLIYRSVRKVANIAGLRDYLKRRFLRIYPLYFVTALAGVLTGVVLFNPTSVLAEIFMFRCLSPTRISNPPTWSLYVEVCFYLLLPVYVLAAGRRVFPVTVALFVVFLFADSAAPKGYDGNTRGELYLWKFFLVGIIVSHAADWLNGACRKAWLKESLGAALFLGGAALLVVDCSGNDWVAQLGLVPKHFAGYTIGLALGFSLVMVGTLASGGIARAVGVWPLRFLGTISYSVYLVHPFYILAGFPNFRFPQVGTVQIGFEAYGVAPWWYAFFVFFPGLILWSAVTYALIERPFQKLRPKEEGATSDHGDQPQPLTVSDSPQVVRRAA
jgi:peptidoglycan/LPS O-acetylase OafA/YrhL